VIGFNVQPAKAPYPVVDLWFVGNPEDVPGYYGGYTSIISLIKPELLDILNINLHESDLIPPLGSTLFGTCLHATKMEVTRRGMAELDGI